VPGKPQCFQLFAFEIKYGTKNFWNNYGFSGAGPAGAPESRLR
jgi:hypothetical protein